MVTVVPVMVRVVGEVDVLVTVPPVTCQLLNTPPVGAAAIDTVSPT